MAAEQCDDAAQKDEEIYDKRDLQEEVTESETTERVDDVWGLGARGRGGGHGAGRQETRHPWDPSATYDEVLVTVALTRVLEKEGGGLALVWATAARGGRARKPCRHVLRRWVRVCSCEWWRSANDSQQVLASPAHGMGFAEFSGGATSQRVPWWHSDRAETERSSWPERLHDAEVLSARVAHVMIG